MTRACSGEPSHLSVDPAIGRIPDAAIEPILHSQVSHDLDGFPVRDIREAAALLPNTILSFGMNMSGRWTTETQRHPTDGGWGIGNVMLKDDYSSEVVAVTHKACGNQGGVGPVISTAGHFQRLKVRQPYTAHQATIPHVIMATLTSRDPSRP